MSPYRSGYSFVYLVFSSDVSKIPNKERRIGK